MRLLFFLIVVSSTTYAGDSCSRPKVKLYFANGVANTRSSAIDSWTTLILEVNDYLKDRPNALKKPWMKGANSFVILNI